MESGRKTFRLARRLLDFGSACLRSCPRRVRYSALALCRSMPGLAGLGLRYMCVKSLARSCGDNVFIGVYSMLTYLENCDIGSNVSIREFCNIGAAGSLRIGSDVSIASGTVILTTEHDYQQSDTPMRSAPLIMKATIIEDDVWIGANASVKAGVCIGQGAVIGLGAVVTRSIPRGAIAVGVPARVIAFRDGRSAADPDEGWHV